MRNLHLELALTWHTSVVLLRWLLLLVLLSLRKRQSSILPHPQEHSSTLPLAPVHCFVSLLFALNLPLEWFEMFPILLFSFYRQFDHEYNDEHKDKYIAEHNKHHALYSGLTDWNGREFGRSGLRVSFVSTSWQRQGLIKS